MCECPTPNPDCEHPTCPRWPQPGHFYAQAVTLVEDWRGGYTDLEWSIAAALAEAARR